MDTITAVRNRILILCEERDITNNRLAGISSLSSLSIKNILPGVEVAYGQITPGCLIKKGSEG